MMRIGHSGPRLDAKFVSVYPREEHGLCKTVTALNRDLGKGFRYPVFRLSRAADLRAWCAHSSIKKDRMHRHFCVAKKAPGTIFPCFKGIFRSKNVSMKVLGFGQVLSEKKKKISFSPPGKKRTWARHKKDSQE